LELTSQGWKDFLFEWNNYATASKLSKEEESVQVATFLAVIGKTASSRYRCFKWTNAEDANKLSKIKGRFEQECTPRTNVVFERFAFNGRKQAPGEPITEYVSALRHLAATCKFEDMSTEDVVDSLIRDKIVCGMQDVIVRSRLLEETSLTLDEAVSIAHAFEQINAHNKVIGGEEPTPATVASAAYKDRREKKQGKFRQTVSSDSLRKSRHRRRSPSSSSSNNDHDECRFCGLQHEYGRCPAYGKDCTNCGKRNHFQRVCKKPKASATVNSVVAAPRQANNGSILLFNDSVIR
jgi:hypothetical protein